MELDLALEKCYIYITMHADLKSVLILTPFLEIKTRTVVKKHLLEELRGWNLDELSTELFD